MQAAQSSQSSQRKLPGLLRALKCCRSSLCSSLSKSAISTVPQGFCAQKRTGPALGCSGSAMASAPLVPVRTQA